MLSQRVLYGTFALIGIANATVKPVRLAVDQNGFFPALLDGFGINAIVWMALAIGMWRLWRDSTENCDTKEFCLVAAGSLGFLVPLASISWIALGATCLLLAVVRMTSPACIGLTVTGLAAIRDPASKALLDILAEPLLALDAYASTVLLLLFGETVERDGNIMATSTDHALFIMSGCSSFTNLSLALLAWASILAGFSKPSWRLLCIGGALLGVAVVFLNSVRLSLMALSGDAYRIVHDGWGADAFLLATSIVIVTSVFAGLRHAR